jgi:hypothetical protein
MRSGLNGNHHGALSATREAANVAGYAYVGNAERRVPSGVTVTAVSGDDYDATD